MTRTDQYGPDEYTTKDTVTVLAFAAGGGGVAIAAYLLFWLVANPSRPPVEVVEILLAGGAGSTPFFAFMSAGLLSGLVAGGYAVGNVTMRKLVRLGANLLIMAFGASIGLVAGAVIYVLFTVLADPSVGFADAVGRLPVAVGDAADPFTAFLLAGALAGAVASAYLLGRHLMDRLARGSAGAVLGAAAGLTVFAAAYVIVNQPESAAPSAWLILVAQGIYSGSALEYTFIALGAGVGTLMSRYSWRLYGLFTLVSLVSVVLGYIFYTLTVTLPLVPRGDLFFSIVLFAAEAFTLTMVILYSFYTLDVSARKRWRRSPSGAQFSPYHLPKVAFHVPAYNEPPEMVIETLEKLLAVDYPEEQFVVMMLDDSTDEEKRRPLERFCRQNGVKYVHREQRGGYKAGALNHALDYTPDDVELIAVIDADYQVEPEYLRETVGYFVDPQLAWVQTPQDYRNRDQSFLTEQYYLADAYFYRTVLPSRNEENSIIFCGTMGILRKDALVGAGGWGETFITEDAELSVRLLDRQWKSLYINKTYGRGLIPATYDGYKQQHHRWAFGGAKILRGRYKDILFGNFTGRQKFDYMVSSVHWMDGLFVIGVGLAVLLLGLGSLLDLDFVTHHNREVLMIGLVPLFLLIDGVARTHMALRKTMGLGFGSTLRVMGMWFSVKFSNMFASLKALIGFNVPFARTPKAPETQVSRGEAAKRSLQMTAFETTVSLIFLATSVALAVKLGTAGSVTATDAQMTRLFLIFWLTYYALVFAAAPVYAYLSYVTFRPDHEIETTAQPTPAAGVA